MNYSYIYKSKLGDIVLISDGKYLTGLYFKDSKYISNKLQNYIQKNLSIFEDTAKWLDIYFKGQVPNFIPKYKIDNISYFQKLVIDELLKIPYGQITTYKDVAINVSKKLKKTKMSCQAVGHAIGQNPISIIIPCHRVIGQKGKLTGYSGGLNNKLELLKIEKINITNK